MGDSVLHDPPSRDEREPRVLSDLAGQPDGDHSGEDADAADEEAVHPEQPAEPPEPRHAGRCVLHRARVGQDAHRPEELRLWRTATPRSE